ncbi:MAG: pilus assembly protein TadG-related protein [Gaiellaceae bacterium]
MLTVVFMTVLLAMAAFVLDVGAWYRADRAAQSEADASALAGAQALPTDTGQATSLALEYADKNGSGVSSGDISFSNSMGPNDSITVHVHKPASGVFTRIFGMAGVTVGAHATARTQLMGQARYVAPITVKNTHPMLAGTTCPCFGPNAQTTLTLGKTGAPGAFGLINLDQSHGGTGPPILADWILHGYDQYLPLGGYYSDPGAKFNSSQVQSALQQRIGSVLLFPVYDTLTGNGANASYHIIGWVGFHLLSFNARGNSGTLTGYFTEVIWAGLQAVSGGPQPPNYGARSVQLID